MQSVDRQTAIVRPFSINGQEMCGNCENYEFITGMNGFCDWCENDYQKKKRKKEENNSQSSASLSQTQSVVTGGGGGGHEEGEEAEVVEEPQRFSQEGQRWTFSQTSSQTIWTPAEQATTYVPIDDESTLDGLD